MRKQQDIMKNKIGGGGGGLRSAEDRYVDVDYIQNSCVPHGMSQETTLVYCTHEKTTK